MQMDPNKCCKIVQGSFACSMHEKGGSQNTDTIGADKHTCYLFLEHMHYSIVTRCVRIYVATYIRLYYSLGTTSKCILLFLVNGDCRLETVLYAHT